MKRLKDKFDFSLVKNPLYYQDNTVDAHSEHEFYESDYDFNIKDNRFRISLNGIWDFHYANNYNQCIDDFYSLEYDNIGWDKIRVPSHIQLEGYDKPQYVNVQYPWEGVDEIRPGDIPSYFNPVASYIKFFEFPEHFENRRTFICFDGVESAMSIWLNGNFVGYHEDSFTKAEFELSEYIVKGQNKLAVQVFKFSSGSWCEDQDFFRFSGIYRDVNLYSVGELYLRDIDVKAVPDSDIKKGEVDIKLKIISSNHIDENKKIRCIVRLQDKDNIIYKQILSDENSDFKYDEDKDCIEIAYKFTADNIKPWSSEHPDLYNLYMEILDENFEFAGLSMIKVGFRRFEIRDSIMYLNNKRIVFKGVNRHDFGSVSGRVPNKEELIKDILTMKRNNINSIRTSHYPNQSLLYDLCDEYGLYVIDENNLETHGTWDKYPVTNDCDFLLPKDKPEWRDCIVDRAAAMYERDKNHACILIWSCGNESYGGKVIYDVSSYFKSKDKNRLVHYEGISWDRSYNDTSDMESRMYATVADIKAYLEEHRDKPFILCEYTHAMGNSCGAMNKYMQLTKEEPLFQGGFIWDYVDQTIYAKNRFGEEYLAYGGDFSDKPNDYNFSANGIVYGGNRDISPKMQEIKYLYQNIDVEFENVIFENRKLEFNIKNNFMFSNLNEFDFYLTVKLEGEFVQRKYIYIDLEPEESKEISVDLDEMYKVGEYTFLLEMSLKHDNSWAERGYVTGHSYVSAVLKKSNEVYESKEKIECIKSLHNIGVRGKNFSAVFSLINGGLISYKYAGEEMLMSSPKPNFFRAPSDNDLGSYMPQRYAQWKIASLYAKPKDIDEKTSYPKPFSNYTYNEYDDKFEIAFKYNLWTNPSSTCELSYTVFADGLVDVKLSYEVVKELGDMPEFSVMFKLDADRNYIKWFGLGPDENYVDRKSGAILDLYESTVENSLSKYVVPQECGNREEVRYCCITDRKKRGLKFIYKNEYFNFSALNYTPNQLEEAMHEYELPRPVHTVVRISKAQMGIGGDDSWGAKTHDEYLLDISKNRIDFEFSFIGI